MPRPRPSIELQRERAHLGRCLSLARERADLSQAMAAERIGVSRPTMSLWESGAGEPLATDLQRLADLYGVTLDELTGRAPLPPPVRRDT